MTAHPSAQSLELFMNGDLPPRESSPIIRHLVAGCSECSETTSQLWEVLVTGREAPVAEPQDYEAAFDRAWDRALEAKHALDAERELAGPRCQELLDLPPHQQTLRVRNDPRFRTLPLCEALIEASKSAVFDDAATACRLAKLSLEITDRLERARYGAAVVADARAEAWSAYANAVRETSDFEEAESALRSARAHLEEGTGNLEAKAKYLNALANVLTERGLIDETLAALRELEAIYSRLDDLHMVGRVLIKRAFALGKKREPERAIPLLARALELIDPARDPRRKGIALHNLVIALIAADRLEEAEPHVAELRSLHAAQNDRLNLLRFRWLEGRLAYAKGDLKSAELCFSEVRNAFVELEIGIDVALVSLDLAEVLWQQGRADETRLRLKEAIPILKALKVNAEALAAVAFLEHSIRLETATRELIRQTAAFVRQTGSDPTVRFQPAELARR